MKRVSFFTILPLFITLLLLLLLAGCDVPKTQGKTSTPTDDLTVAAASDLKLAFTEVGMAFEKSTDKKVKFSFGSTGMLAQQIENGAPFDVFAAADVNFIDKLKENGMVVPDTQQLYAIGRIGLATPVHSKLQLKELDDLLKPEVKKIAIANPEHAPYGLAAKQALESAGIWGKLKDKMVYGKNITETLQLIETGNAETGIIALSLIKKDKLKFHLIDNKLHQPLKQSMAVIKGTKQEKTARDFLTFVNGSEGRAIMKRYGFILPGDRS